MYKIVNRLTGQIVSSRKTRTAAIKRVDALDMAYGAYIHYIVNPDATA